MTGKRKALNLPGIISSLSQGSLNIEIRKSSRGSVAVIMGVMSIGEYTESNIELLSHSGRVGIMGESLSISVLEGRTVEIYGKRLVRRVYSG